MKVKLIIVDVFENSVFPSKINYFITSGRLTKWVYSTNECYKIYALNSCDKRTYFVLVIYLYYNLYLFSQQNKK